MESRRRFIGGTAGGAVAALAGCMDNSYYFPSNRGQYADLVASDGNSPLGVSGSKPNHLAGIDDFDPADFGQPLGIDLSAVDHTIAVSYGQPDDPGAGFYSILFTSVGFDTLRSGVFQGTEIESQGDFRTLVETESDTLYGFNDGTIVIGESRERYELAIDLLQSDQPLLIDEHSDFETVADIIGDADHYGFTIDRDPFIDVAAVGNPKVHAMGFYVKEGNSDLTTAAVYETEDEAETQETGLEEGMLNFFQSLENTETEVDGRTVIFRATVPTANL